MDYSVASLVAGFIFMFSVPADDPQKPAPDAKPLTTLSEGMSNTADSPTTGDIRDFYGDGELRPIDNLSTLREGVTR